jgi:hypothetical protein
VSVATVTISNVCTDKFQTDIATPESLSVSYPNEVMPAPSNEMHARCSVLLGGRALVTAGKAGERDGEITGQFIVSLFAPLDKGSKDSDVMADKIATAFTAVTVSGVTFQVASVTVLGEVRGEWQTNITCPFYYREQI